MASEPNGTPEINSTLVAKAVSVRWRGSVLGEVKRGSVAVDRCRQLEATSAEFFDSAVPTTVSMSAL